MKITEEYFKEAVGSAPEQDDLDRCNCERAGKVGHFDCGWNTAHNKPNFMVPHRQQEHRQR